MIHFNLRHRIGRFVRLPSETVNRLRIEAYRRHQLPRLVDESTRRWTTFESDDAEDLRRRILSYVSSNHRPEFGIGAYSYLPGGPPILYASCYAVLTRHLFGDLDSLTGAEMRDWARYIQGFQQEDGLFRDPVIDCPRAAEWLSWGWRHLTFHATMALSGLQTVAQRPFKVLDSYRERGAVSGWLDGRRWVDDAANVSNEIQNIATLLQYARDFQGQNWCDATLDELFDWLDRHQDPQTGSWGYGTHTPIERSLGVQTGYHLWLLYFYDGRPLQYVERIIDSCIETQNPLGGFGAVLNSSACEDIDTIDPLARLSSFTSYRRDEILTVLKKAVPWVLANLNTDGGGVFRRGQSFHYGHDLMHEEKNQSAMFPSWFRTLSLGYLAQVLDSQAVPVDAIQFIRCPGVQFWRGSIR